ncbi:MAG: RNA-binding protein [Proteobacteria bacterium]|nr:RNA-binding protein [Pseudomonadota bacterium]MBU1710974.1 RNA-binding protein [Pseudomonadota bacterium]
MTEEIKVRIDKWLWAARFFKTRSLAAIAVAGGKVHCNNARIKPAKTVSIGDELRIQRGEVEFIVIVHELSGRRGPAVVAQKMYEETGESISARAATREERRLLKPGSNFGPEGRPGKKDRRLIRRFTRKD